MENISAVVKQGECLLSLASLPLTQLPCRSPHRTYRHVWYIRCRTTVARTCASNNRACPSSLTQRRLAGHYSCCSSTSAPLLLSWHIWLPKSHESTVSICLVSQAIMPECLTFELPPTHGTYCYVLGACYVYGRSFNPTVRGLGRQLAALEDMEAGYACSSGALWLCRRFLKASLLHDLCSLCVTALLIAFWAFAARCQSWMRIIY